MTRKHGIFITMFIWFWLVMTAVVIAQFAWNEATEKITRNLHQEEVLATMLTFYGQVAADLYERGDIPGLVHMFSTLHSSAGAAAYLFSGDTEVTGNRPRRKLALLAAQASISGTKATLSYNDRVLAAVNITSPKGRPYVAAGIIYHTGPIFDYHDALLWLSRLVIVLIISGVACYLLARHLTVPIIKLSQATKRLASGDLSVRSNPSVRSRHDEIGALSQDFDVMAERIETLVTSQRQLLGNVSHELRSPLARINVALEIARQHAGAQAGKPLDRIGVEAERLNELIGQVLVLTRLESGIAEIQKERVDLTGLVQEIVADADFEAGSVNKAVRIVGNEGGTVTGVRHLLHSAIENVIRNAVRYTREETTVEVGVCLLEDKTARHAQVKVRDHGPGVPEADLDRLFHPFYRVGDARDRQTGGTGLGLAITEGAVRLHGGSVGASNAPDGGLVIEIKLPL